MKTDFVIDFLGFIIVKAFSIFLWGVPLKPALWIGRRIGDAAYCANTKRRMIAYANLKAAFPGKSSGELKKINKAHFENLGMNIIELLKLPVMARDYFERHVKLENTDKIRYCLEKGKGVILLTAHFGNWEISSLAVSLNGYTMSVFAREQKYKRLNNLLNEFRQSTGCRVITKGFSVKDIIKTLNNNGIVGMLSDQDAGANGIFINFFNRPASTAQGAIAFSSKTEAEILPSFIRRVGTDKHIARAGDPFELVNTGNKERDTKENLQKITDILEDYVRKFPEQWLWSHKRWKSTPQRSVIVLTDGKAGHLNQAMGTAEMTEHALCSRLEARKIKEKPVVKICVSEVKFKNKFTKMLLNISSIFASKRCQGCLRCLEFCLTKESFENLKNRYADIIISCGSSAAAVNIFLKYENNAKNIIIMKPGMGRDKKVDLIILPRHDVLQTTLRLRSGQASDERRTMKNILITEGAPNRITQEAMGKAVDGLKAQLGAGQVSRKGIGLLIGGDAKGFKLIKEDVRKAVDEVIKISEEKALDIFLSTSRRTPPEIDELLKEKLSRNKRCKLLIIANEKNIEGAAPAILGLSDIIVISQESMSMISEAASSGKHVIVFRRGEKDTKYGSMVSNLEKNGYIYTARPEEIYNKIKEILETRPEVRRLDDREKIIERLKGIM